MLLTQEEAKQKWCPMAVEAGEGASTHNRMGGKGSTGCYCIALECMSWRETGKARQRQLLGYCALIGEK